MTALLLPAQPAEAAGPGEFRRAVLDGLARTPKAIPSKFFYDAAGSRLFERICALDAYYPTRTEIAILRAHAGDMARLLPVHAVVVEPGAGAIVKARLLLDALDRPAGYVPIDISGEHLVDSAVALAQDRPGFRIVPVVADFSRPFHLPETLPSGPRVGFFPGSTVGNFSPGEAASLLRMLGRRLGSGAPMLVGVDLTKDPAVLVRAYDDGEGVTAAFNLNLLTRVNREIGGDFDLDAFAHRAVWNAAAGRIEMHLASRRPQVVTVAGRRFRFAAGETIHTENSYKYTIDGFQAMSAAAGYRPVAVWTDDAALFSVHLLAFDSADVDPDPRVA